MNVYSGRGYMTRIVKGKQKSKNVNLYILAQDMNKARGVVLRGLGAKSGAISQSIGIELVVSDVTRDEWDAWKERDQELDPEFSRWLQVHREGY